MTDLIHPSENPTPPFWRGANDLIGPFGDYLYGGYNRSINAYVKTGTSVVKRRGFVRAVDTDYWGSAALAYRRDGNVNYHVIADGSGVRALETLPASTYSGFTADHPGFMSDDFDRPNAAAITAQGVAWWEGKDSDETPSRTENDTLKILNNDLVHDPADNSSASAEWNIEAPGPYHYIRAEIDTDTALVGTGTEVMIATGLPGSYIYTDANGDTQVKSRQFMADAYHSHVGGYHGTVDTCWTGLVFRIRFVRQATTHYTVHAIAAEFLSDRRQEDIGTTARSGKMSPSRADVTASVTAAQISGKWVVEFGRKRESTGTWRVQLRVWDGKDIADLEAGTTGSVLINAETALHGINVSNGLSGYYGNFPLSGKGGYGGVRITDIGTPTDIVTIPKITTSLTRA